MMGPGAGTEQRTVKQVWHTVRERLAQLLGAGSTLPEGDLVSQQAQPEIAVAGPPGAEASEPAPAAATSEPSPVAAASDTAPVATMPDAAPVAAVPGVTHVSGSMAPPGKSSIAVLAFTNMTGDVDQEYFADGIAEDITTQLSRSDALFVIACNSSFAYKGQESDVRRIGRELEVRYVLQGSVRRDGAVVQISAQVTDVQTGKQVWTQRSERAITDLFELQDEIALAVALAIDPGISPVERQRIVCRPIVSMAQCQHSSIYAG